MERLSRSLVNVFEKRNIIEPEYRQLCITGVNLILADLLNFFLILFIGLFFRRISHSVCFLVVMWTVRWFCGGYHAKTYWQCRLTIIATFLGILAVSFFLRQFSVPVMAICYAVTIVTVIFFAPVKHPNKTMTAKRRKKNKCISIILTSVFILCSILLFTAGRAEGYIIALTLFAISVLMYMGLWVNKRQEKEVNGNG